MSRPRHFAQSSGVTLLELLVVMAIVAILSALAAPSMYEWMMAQRVKSAAADMVTDIRFMRSEGLTRNQPMQLSFAADAGQTCYTVQTLYDGSACNCLSNDPCGALVEGAKEIKTTSLPKSKGVTLSWNNSSNYFLTADKFKAQPALIVVITGLENQTLQVNVTTSTRRPSICVPATSKITGYPSCT